MESDSKVVNGVPPKNLCNDFINKRCTRQDCKFTHEENICSHFWRFNTCKFNDNCKFTHFTNPRATLPTNVEGGRGTFNGGSAATSKPNVIRRSKKNTECFEPMTKPVDLRIVSDLNSHSFNTTLTSRDVLLAPNVFNDFKPGELYNQLVAEINSCGIPEEKLLKLWHGNDKIEGTHLIADDKTSWKNQCPTFKLIIDRLKNYFNMNIQATRFNWYTDTSQWKPFHHDAAAVKPEKAAVQNFTVAVSFGATRDAAFEHATTKTVVSMPQPDGWIYAFSKDTNIIWRHGILQDKIIRNEGRISVIAWGYIDNMEAL
jgi:hypothetical protein